MWVYLLTRGIPRSRYAYPEDAFEGSETPVSFQWKNPDFLLKNLDFILKNVDFLLKNLDFII